MIEKKFFSGLLCSWKPSQEKKSSLGPQWSKFLVQDLFLRFSKLSVLKKYVSKLKRFCERLKSINFHHNMCNSSLQFYWHLTKGYVYTVAAQDSIIKPLFHSFEFASESFAVKSQLILTEVKWVLSKGMSEGINWAFRV